MKHVWRLMTESEKENPYRPTGNEEPVPEGKLEHGSKSSVAQTLVAFLIAFVVAIPVFFTTCVGGGFTVAVLHVPLPGNWGSDCSFGA